MAKVKRSEKRALEAEQKYKRSEKLRANAEVKAVRLQRQVLMLRKQVLKQQEKQEEKQQETEDKEQEKENMEEVNQSRSKQSISPATVEAPLIADTSGKSKSSSFDGSDEKSDHEKIILEVGLTICARYDRGEDWYKGKILAIAGDDLFDIEVFMI